MLIIYKFTSQLVSDRSYRYREFIIHKNNFTVTRNYKLNKYAATVSTNVPH